MRNFLAKGPLPLIVGFLFLVAIGVFAGQATVAQFPTPNPGPEYTGAPAPSGCNGTAAAAAIPAGYILVPASTVQTAQVATVAAVPTSTCHGAQVATVAAVQQQQRRAPLQNAKAKRAAAKAARQATTATRTVTTASVQTANVVLAAPAAVAIPATAPCCQK